MPHPFTATMSRVHRIITTGALAALLVIGAPGDAQAAMAELDNCTTPKYVVFTNPGDKYGPYRTVYYNGASAPIVLPANPEMNEAHAAGHLQNCTRNSNPNHVQWVTFKLVARNWFGTPNEDHLVVAMRGKFLNLNTSQPSYDARGPIVHRFWGGILGERIALNVPGVTQTHESLGQAADPGFFQNGVTYQIEVHASRNGVAYRATNTATNATTGWRYYGQIPGDVDTAGTGLGFVVICNGPGGVCRRDSAFNVYFWDIATGWFAP